MGEMAEAFYTTPVAIRWLTRLVGIALPFRLKRRGQRRILPDVPTQAAATQSHGRQGVTSRAAQCGNIELPEEWDAERSQSAHTESVRRTPFLPP